MKLQIERIADFAVNAKYEQLDEALVMQLKLHLLDSVASLLHSLNKPVMQRQIRQLAYFKNTGPCKVPLLETLPVDRAAQLYTALIRYPDFMDNFLGKDATCHPSDNIGALLAVSQLKETSGKDLLLAMAIAYQIECRLIEEIPVMSKGFDHTSLLFSAAAGAGRLQGYSAQEIAHALAIGGVTFNPLITTRAVPTSEWKGFASSLAIMGVINILMLAKEGMTGPLTLFEGPEGYPQIHSMKLDYDWENENFELVRKCILKKYNAEVHAQSSIEAVLKLCKENKISPDFVDKVEVATFLTAYHIIGSGEYGDRYEVHTKEQADHSLPYVIAVAILDGEVTPQQFTPQRINSDDVQAMLRKIKVHTKFPLTKPRTLIEHIDPYTIAYPDKVDTHVKIVLKDDKELEATKEDYHGFFTRPLSWTDVEQKLRDITTGIIDSNKQNRVIDAVASLDKLPVATLIEAICS